MAKTRSNGSLLIDAERHISGVARAKFRIFNRFVGSINSINGHPGVMGAVHQTSGSNATKINLQIDELIAETSRKMPADIKIVTFDNTFRVRREP